MIKVGFQMDPLDNIDPRLDTSFRLAEEAELRGYSVFHYLPNNLTFCALFNFFCFVFGFFAIVLILLSMFQ